MRKIRVKFITGYHGTAKRWGISSFANGFTLRAGSLAVHMWRT
jgi:hypothetical protein